MKYRVKKRNISSYYKIINILENVKHVNQKRKKEIIIK